MRLPSAARCTDSATSSGSISTENLVINGLNAGRGLEAVDIDGDGDGPALDADGDGIAGFVDDPILLDYSDDLGDIFEGENNTSPQSLVLVDKLTFDRRPNNGNDIVLIVQ